MLTVEEIISINENAMNDYTHCSFDSIESPLSKRRDLCAFLKLNELFPNKTDAIIACSEHDIIYLSISIEELAENPAVNEDTILYLIRCGVSFDTSDGLTMFT